MKLLFHSIKLLKKELNFFFISLEFVTVDTFTAAEIGIQGFVEFRFGEKN